MWLVKWMEAARSKSPTTVVPLRLILACAAFKRMSVLTVEEVRVKLALLTKFALELSVMLLKVSAPALATFKLPTVRAKPPGLIVKDFSTAEKSASGSVEVVEADNGIFVIFHDFFLQMSGRV